MKHLEIALGEFGVKEIVGSKHNPRILDYFKLIGHQWVTTDETAWCTAFINWVCLMANLPYSGALNARSFLNVGEEICDPKMGDFTVLWRESPESWKGHVGIYIRETKYWIYILGGNQNNQVKIKAYPKSRVLQHRRLKT